MQTWLGQVSLASTVLLLSQLSTVQPSRAQSCTPLGVVGGSGSRVEKQVSPPGTGVTSDNWNTDYVVPSNSSFNRYVANIYPKNGGEYDIQMNLKYNDDTVGNVYSRTTNLPENQTFSIAGTPRAGAVPYQVNLQIGGVPALGKTYVASVLGCY